MTFPDYIPTRTVTAGKAFALETAAPLPVKISVRASRSLIWGATGYRFEAVGAAATGEGFDEASLELPVTDLNGWRDANTRAEIEISEEGFQTHSHTYSADVTVGSKTYKIGPFVLPSGMGDIDLDLAVPTGTEAGTSVLIPDEWSRIASEAAEEAVKAAEEARKASDEAQAILTQDAAIAWGFYPVYSIDPPTETEKFGVPVVWISAVEQVSPTLVNPLAPTWTDLDSSFTVPDVVGVRYVWTSGGGGSGQILTPGVPYATSGNFPRNVAITPEALPGYILAPGLSLPFKHDFPDPLLETVLTSDSFSSLPPSRKVLVTFSGEGAISAPPGTFSRKDWGTQVASEHLPSGTFITGTPDPETASLSSTSIFSGSAEVTLQPITLVGAFSDAYLGGEPVQYKTDNTVADRTQTTTAFSGFSFVPGPGSLGFSSSTRGDGSLFLPFPGSKNVRASVTIPSLLTNSTGEVSLSIGRRFDGPVQHNDSAYYAWSEVSLGPSSVVVRTRGAVGGNTTLGNFSSAFQPGEWSIQLFLDTVTVRGPGGFLRVFDISDPALFRAASTGQAAPFLNMGTRVRLLKDSGDSEGLVSSLQVTELGV